MNLEVEETLNVEEEEVRDRVKKGRKSRKKATTNRKKSYEVEAILTVKEEEVTLGRGNKRVKSLRPLWFVKWRYFDDSNNSWITRECFANDASREEDSLAPFLIVWLVSTVLSCSFYHSN